MDYKEQLAQKIDQIRKQQEIINKVNSINNKLQRIKNEQNLYRRKIEKLSDGQELSEKDEKRIHDLNGEYNQKMNELKTIEY
ncbi:MAG: hypothetical protein M0Q51_00840 [Bacteroidales bacterium]|nr:hypothetical protein [Bacteroidales bacterium]